MCCTLEAATLSNTRIYSAEVRRPDTGQIVHVIGYQNTVEAPRGPNAMLLPFPAKGKVGPENLVNGESFKGVLEAYERAVQRQDRPRGTFETKSAGAAAAGTVSYQVFESGSYTIALADKPSLLGKALREVPEARRPNMPFRFVSELNQLYPDWPIALCCFEGGDMAPEPLFWWFEPRYPNVLFAPAIDAHDGNPPNPTALVDRDHTIAFGCSESNLRHDEILTRDIATLVPREHQWLFTDRVVGKQYVGQTRNGDFVTSLEELRGQRHTARVGIRIAEPPRGGELRVPAA